MGELLGLVDDAIRTERPIALVTTIRGPRLGAKMVVDGSGHRGTLGDAELDRVVSRDALRMLELDRTGTRTYGTHGEARVTDVEVFIQSFTSPPRMYVFGAIDFAAALSRIGKFLGYKVTVCDPRESFATRARFPDADEIVTRWPHEFLAEVDVDRKTVICVLTHDLKFDVPLLKAALATNAGYIGAMGSRRTHESRTKELLEEGVESAQLDRISGPIGLDLGARTPEEVAISIAAEIIALRSGASGRRLAATEGPIHHPLTERRSPR